MDRSKLLTIAVPLTLVAVAVYAQVKAPPQTRHSVKNTGAGALKYVYLVAPTGGPRALTRAHAHP